MTAATFGLIPGRFKVRRILGLALVFAGGVLLIAQLWGMVP
jgi:hypothetical protein